MSIRDGAEVLRLHFLLLVRVRSLLKDPKTTTLTSRSNQLMHAEHPTENGVVIFAEPDLQVNAVSASALSSDLMPTAVKNNLTQHSARRMVGVKLSSRSYKQFCLLVVLACAALHFTARVESLAWTAMPLPPVMRKNLLQPQRDASPYPATMKRHHLHTARASCQQSMRLYASSDNDDDDDDDDDDDEDKDKNIPDDDAGASQNPNPNNPNPPPYSHDYSTEEILLCLHLRVASGIEVSDALERVQAYSQSFPFAAVLPVQPLSYLPTVSGGVEIKFLRKKTDEKSGTEGGLCFFIDTTGGGNTATEDAAAAETAAEDIADDNDNDNDDIDNDDDDKSNSRMIVLTVKRNSAGQTIRKIIAERLVVTSYVASLTATGDGDDSDSDTPATPGAAVITGSRPSPVAERVVRVTSLFHKWM
jgi:hypothetical protein